MTHPTARGPQEEPAARLRRRRRTDPPKPMGTPRQLLNLYLGETYRYRLAMNEQLPRIEAAAYELRLRWDTDVFARIVDDNWGEKARTMNETQFFFVAVRGILSMARAMKEVASEDVFPTVHAKVSAAIDRFDRDAPHAKDMRDFLTHLDAYMAGAGHKELPNPEQSGMAGRPPRGTWVCEIGKSARWENRRMDVSSRFLDLSHELADRRVGISREGG